MKKVVMYCTFILVVFLIVSYRFRFGKSEQLSQYCGDNVEYVQLFCREMGISVAKKGSLGYTVEGEIWERDCFGGPGLFYIQRRKFHADLFEKRLYRDHGPGRNRL